jgi:hypothetical protein
MIRALVQRLPVMICPRWVSVKAQPIAVEDLVAYILQALKLPDRDAALFEIGGADQVSYGDIMQEYAWQCGLSRLDDPGSSLTPSPFEFVAGSSYADPRSHRTQACRQHAQPNACAGPVGAESVRYQAERFEGCDRRSLTQSDSAFLQT